MNVKKDFILMLIIEIANLAKNNALIVLLKVDIARFAPAKNSKLLLVLFVLTNVSRALMKTLDNAFLVETTGFLILLTKIVYLFI